MDRRKISKNLFQAMCALALVAILALGGVSSTGATPEDNTLVAWGNNNWHQADVPHTLTNIVAIEAGLYSSLALQADGRIVGWGNNNSGQSIMPAGVSSLSQVSTGAYFSLGILSDKTVVAWGSNSYGQTNVPAGLNNVIAVSAGSDFSLALKDDGTVAAWGNNSLGQTNVPDGLSGVVAISGGGSHGLALKNDGSVVAWGNNASGQAAVPANATNIVAIAAGAEHSLALKSDGTLVSWGYVLQNRPSGSFTAIAAGMRHAVALKSDGTVVAWGLNIDGQTNVPAGLADVTAISAGGSHNLALKSDGTVVAWGYNGEGACNVPYDLTSIVAIEGGIAHSLVLKSDGTVDGWGYNSAGQAKSPAGLTDVVQIAAGIHHNLARKSDGTVVAWGSNQDGATNVPAGLNSVIDISAGNFFSVALKSDGTVVAWGKNDLGQTNVPTDLTGVVDIEAGTHHTLALKSDGTVVAWGSNAENRSTIPAGLTGVIAISAGNHSLALKSDHTVVAWGNNYAGQINVPSGLKNVIAIAAGGGYSLALKSNRTVVSWGDPNAAAPAGLTHVIVIEAGYSHALALTSPNIPNTAPVADPGGPYQGAVNIATAFSGLGSSDAEHDPLDYAWTFGDGATSADAAPSHTYTAAGSYNACLTVNDGLADSATACATVEVTNTAPVANPGGPYQGVVKTPIAFSGSGSSDANGDPLTYAWAFGDGATATGVAPSHTYTIAGSYNACLTVNDGTVNSQQACATVEVTNTAPVANPGGPYQGAVNIAIAFDGSHSSDANGDPLTYAWIFGDGSTGIGGETSHSYGTAGTYDVCLTVNDGEVDSAQACTTVEVTNTTPVANPGGPYQGQINTAIDFSGSGSSDANGDPLTYAWTFGDGSSGTGVSPSHSYTTAGTYSACLTVNDGEVDSEQACTTAEVYASNTAPVANPGGPYLGAINTAIAFSGSASSDADGDPLTYAWSFGDGSTGTGIAPSHSYAAAGIFDACLTVNDGEVNSAQACTMAVVYDPSAGFTTGGGWINSPAGAYKLAEALSGRANFGFVSRYKKGATLPSGTTSFQFEMGSFTFDSTAYDWLVVNQVGMNAQFKGSGTVNGLPDANGNPYKFMLWAGDGSKTSVDTFRIRIWWEDATGEHDVYDNDVNQPIGAGNIIVHTGK